MAGNVSLIKSELLLAKASASSMASFLVRFFRDNVLPMLLMNPVTFESFLVIVYLGCGGLRLKTPHIVYTLKGVSLLENLQLASGQKKLLNDSNSEI